MAKYRIVRTNFWNNPIVLEEMTREDKYFYLYLLTNPHTTQIGIYRITKKQMAFDLGYSLESIQALMDRFIRNYQLIRYNPETRELALKSWGTENLEKGGKPVVDCIISELKEVEDCSLIRYVAESIPKQDIRSLYESFYQQEETFIEKEDSDQDEKDTYQSEREELGDTFLPRPTIRGQKEQQKENEKEKQQQQQAFQPSIENQPGMENSLQRNQDVREIVEFWDANGFGFTNINAKEQLLCWLDDSHFLKPKEIILKAMNIACSNNKRQLNYIIGILKNWENESLLTAEDIDLYSEIQQHLRKRALSESVPRRRRIPSEFELDLTDD